MVHYQSNAMHESEGESVAVNVSDYASAFQFVYEVYTALKMKKVKTFTNDFRTLKAGNLNKV